MMPSPRVRRHGFAGQHMVVVPDPIRRQVRHHPLLRGLCVTDAGYFPRAANHRVERPQGAATDLIMACLRGHGWVRVDRRTETVGPGDVVWLRADHPHAGPSERGRADMCYFHARRSEQN